MSAKAVSVTAFAAARLVIVTRRDRSTTRAYPRQPAERYNRRCWLFDIVKLESPQPERRR
jgi:hypothetical protein